MTHHNQSLRERLIDLSGMPGSPDPSADLRRGRRALVRRRTRIAAVVSGTGVAAAAAWSALPGGDAAHPAGDLSVASGGKAPATSETPPSPSEEGEQHDLFTYPALGHGYTEVDDQGPAVQFTRPGQQVKSFLDSPVLSLEDKSWPMRYGQEVAYRGATFYDNRQEPCTIVSLQIDTGDWLQMQYPDDSGLSPHEVYDFLLAVQVAPGARGAVG